MKYTRNAAILVAAAALGLAACSTPNDPYRTTYPESTTYPNPPVQEVARYGYVESIETVTPKEGPGVGALGGAQTFHVTNALCKRCDQRILRRGRIAEGYLLVRHI